MVGGPGCLWNRAKPHLAQSGRSQPEAPRVSETKAVADGSSTRLCMTFIELFRAPVPSAPFGAVRCQVLLFHQMERHPQKKRKKEKRKQNGTTNLKHYEGMSFKDLESLIFTPPVSERVISFVIYLVPRTAVSFPCRKRISIERPRRSRSSGLDSIFDVFAVVLCTVSR